MYLSLTIRGFYRMLSSWELGGGFIVLLVCAQHLLGAGKLRFY